MAEEPHPVTEEPPAEAVADIQDRLWRALADLENLRKRYEREVAREREAEGARVAATWLPVVDNLERALEHAGADPVSLIEGVRATYRQAVDALEALGYERFEDIGRPFDPTRHEAVGAVDADAPPGTIVGAARPGYGSRERVLRPAAVVVAKDSR